MIIIKNSAGHRATLQSCKRYSASAFVKIIIKWSKHMLLYPLQQKNNIITCYLIVINKKASHKLDIILDVFIILLLILKVHFIPLPSNGR